MKSSLPEKRGFGHLRSLNVKKALFYIEGWEKSVRSYRTEDNVDIIITGSNSKMLSGELGTLLGGRYEQILVQSLTYTEFLQFHQLTDSDEALWKYLNYGGLPGLKAIGDAYPKYVISATPMLRSANHEGE